MDNKIAVVTIPMNEWNEQKALLKRIGEQVNSIISKEDKELMTPKEVCKALKIGRTTYERYVNDGLIQLMSVSQKKGSRKYIKRSHLNELIENGSV